MTHTSDTAYLDACLLLAAAVDPSTAAQYKNDQLCWARTHREHRLQHQPTLWQLGVASRRNTGGTTYYTRDPYGQLVNVHGAGGTYYFT